MEMAPKNRFLALALAAAILCGAAALRYAGLLRRWDAQDLRGLPSAQASSRLSLPAPEARSVSVAGDFNGWKEQALEKGPGGLWTAAFDLPSGDQRYVFHVDDEWVLDPSARRSAKAGPLTVSLRTVP